RVGREAQYFDVEALLEGTETLPGFGREDPTASAGEAPLGGPERTGEGAIGTVLGPWRLEEVLGRGTSATVFRARHLVLARPAAVKIMHAADAGSEVLKKR